MTIFLIGSFSLPSLAQDRTKSACHNSKTNITTVRTRRYLRTINYPWYVCLEGNNLSHKEREWTRQAMQEWNNAYYYFKIKWWGSPDVVGIPKGPLFMESCNDAYHGVIYIKKSHLPGYTLGKHQHRDSGISNVFHSLIEMDIRTWGQFHFINVMIHELGHALGLSHAWPGTSEIMISHGFDCETGGEEKICDIGDIEFILFLKPYNPSDAMTRAERDAKRAEEARQRQISDLSHPCGGEPMYKGKCL